MTCKPRTPRLNCDPLAASNATRREFAAMTYDDIQCPFYVRDSRRIRWVVLEIKHDMYIDDLPRISMRKIARGQFDELPAVIKMNGLDSLIICDVDAWVV